MTSPPPPPTLCARMPIAPAPVTLMSPPVDVDGHSPAIAAGPGPKLDGHVRWSTCRTVSPAAFTTRMTPPPPPIDCATMPCAPTPVVVIVLPLPSVDIDGAAVAAAAASRRSRVVGVELRARLAGDDAAAAADRSAPGCRRNCCPSSRSRGAYPSETVEGHRAAGAVGVLAAAGRERQRFRTAASRTRVRRGCCRRRAIPPPPPIDCSTTPSAASPVVAMRAGTGVRRRVHGAAVPPPPRRAVAAAGGAAHRDRARRAVGAVGADAAAAADALRDHGGRAEPGRADRASDAPWSEIRSVTVPPSPPPPPLPPTAWSRLTVIVGNPPVPVAAAVPPLPPPPPIDCATTPFAQSPAVVIGARTDRP